MDGFYSGQRGGGGGDTCWKEEEALCRRSEMGKRYSFPSRVSGSEARLGLRLEKRSHFGCKGEKLCYHCKNKDLP